MKGHLKQSYTEKVQLPEMKPVAEMLQLFQFPHQGQRFRDPKKYKLLHKRWELPAGTEGTKSTVQDKPQEPTCGLLARVDNFARELLARLRAAAGRGQ